MIKIETDKTQEFAFDPAGLVEQKKSYGTGFYISDDGLILTAAHVVSRASKLKYNAVSCIELATGKQFAGRIVKIDKSNDIALLQRPYVRQKIKNFVNIRTRQFQKPRKKKVPCFCIGIPNKLHRFNKMAAFSNGSVIDFSINITGYKKLRYRREVILTNCEATSGFSGGIIVDSSYKPLGLILGIWEKEGKVFCFGRNFLQVKQFLKKYENEDN